MKRYTITVNGQAYDVQVEEKPYAVAPVQPMPVVEQPVQESIQAPVTVQPTENVTKEADTQAAPVSAPSADAEVISAPMPGSIISVAVAVGDSVKEGDVLVVLEAMKMENDIVAARDAVIDGVHVQKGDTVAAGAALVSLK